MSLVCYSCQTERGVKMRDDEHGESSYCNACWKVISKDLDLKRQGKFICMDCGSRRAERRIMQTGADGGMGGIMCNECFQDMMYEFMD